MAKNQIKVRAILDPSGVEVGANRISEVSHQSATESKKSFNSLNASVKKLGKVLIAFFGIRALIRFGRRSVNTFDEIS